MERIMRVEYTVPFEFPTKSKHIQIGYWLISHRVIIPPCLPKLQFKGKTVYIS